MKDNIDTLDAVAQRLRETEPAIADGDFTAAVMMQAPRNRQLPAWLGNTLLLGATVLGSAIAAWHIRVPIAAIVFQALTNEAPIALGTAAALVYVLAGTILWMARES